MRFNPTYLVLAVFIALVAVTEALIYEHEQIIALSNSLAAVKASLDASISKIENTASTTAANTAASIVELAGRKAPVEKSQGQLLQEAVANVTPAVVSIVGSIGGGTISTGTGFIVRGNGYIITNKHVVSDTSLTYTVLLTSGGEKNATIVWRSPSDNLSEDLAVLKIEGSGYPRIPLGNSEALQLAQSVFAVGNALGKFNNSVSVGVISGLNRTITASDNAGNTETLSGIIQTDAAINPGNSGGPLVNLAGEAVGINVAIAKGSQSIGFALPISVVKAALAQLGI